MPFLSRTFNQTLENTKKNPYSKREWKDASIIQLFDLFEER
jgi:hypothetical protein